MGTTVEELADGQGGAKCFIVEKLDDSGQIEHRHFFIYSLCDFVQSNKKFRSHLASGMRGRTNVGRQNVQSFQSEFRISLLAAMNPERH